MFVISACGGGDGAPKLPSLALDMARSEFYFGGAFTLADLADYLGLTGLVAFIEVATSPDGASSETACSGGGSVRTTLTDRDRSGGLTGGDRIAVVFSSCREGNTTLDAHFNVDLRQISGGLVTTQQVSPQADDPRVVLSVDIESYSQADNFGVFNASGTLDLDFQFNATEDRFTVAADWLDTTFSAGNRDQTVSLHAYRRENLLNYDQLAYRISLNGEVHLDTTELRGYYSFDTGNTASTTPLTGAMDRFPNDGKLNLRGARDTYLRLEPEIPGGELAALFGPPSAPGGPETRNIMFWSAVVGPEFFAPLRSTSSPVQSAPTVNAYQRAQGMNGGAAEVLTSVIQKRIRNLRSARVAL